MGTLKADITTKPKQVKTVTGTKATRVGTTCKMRLSRVTGPEPEILIDCRPWLGLLFLFPEQ